MDVFKNDLGCTGIMAHFAKPGYQTEDVKPNQNKKNQITLSLGAEYTVRSVRYEVKLCSELMY